MKKIYKFMTVAGDAIDTLGLHMLFSAPLWMAAAGAVAGAVFAPFGLGALAAAGVGALSGASCLAGALIRMGSETNEPPLLSYPFLAVGLPAWMAFHATVGIGQGMYKFGFNKLNELAIAERQAAQKLAPIDIARKKFRERGALPFPGQARPQEGKNPTSARHDSGTPKPPRG